MTYAEVIVRPNGTVEYIHNDALKPLAAALGTPETRRASEVETFLDLSVEARLQALRNCKIQRPDLDTAKDFQKICELWFADMTRSNKNRVLVLGPFDSRQAALNAEVAWIHKNRFGITDHDSHCPAAPIGAKDPAAESSDGNSSSRVGEVVREPLHDALDPAEPVPGSPHPV